MFSASSPKMKLIVLQLWFALVTAGLTPAVRAQALGVIVNPTIGVQHLSRREVLDIFLGRYRTFPSGASALPIDLDINSNERRQFYMLLAHKDSSDKNTKKTHKTKTKKKTPPKTETNTRMALD